MSYEEQFELLLKIINSKFENVDSLMSNRESFVLQVRNGVLAEVLREFEEKLKINNQ